MQDKGEDIKNIQNIKNEIASADVGIKKPTRQELVQFEEIVARIEVDFLNDKGRVPKSKLADFLKLKEEKTSHIFSPENVIAYKKKKKLKKQLNAERAIIPKFNRMKVIYEVGFLDTNLYYEYFIDFRTRIYASG